MPSVVDYSYAHPAPQTVKGAGYLGAIRYLGWDYGRSVRCISPAERDSLFSAGLDLGLVWETTANMTLRGAPGGSIDGAEANRLANVLGYPANRPIYYAVDFGASPGQFGVIEAYMVAAAAQGRSVGVYGMYDIAEYFGARGYNWIWQCAAWSGNGTGSGGSIQGRRLSKYACLYQRVGYVLNNTCDTNDVLKEDWGQWHYQSTPTPQPLPQEGDMAKAYKFEGGAAVWRLVYGWLDKGFKRDGGPVNGYTPVDINDACLYWSHIASGDELAAMQFDGQVNGVVYLAAGNNTVDRWFELFPHADSV